VHIPDLERCKYSEGMLNADQWNAPLLAVGWLEDGHPFPLGAVTPDFVSKLHKLVSQMRAAFPHYGYRGVHVCSICVANQMKPPGIGWSQENLLVPSTNVVYASPGGIVHYVEEHRYSPPEAFVEAVLQCPDCDSEDYLSALHTANGGLQPPIKSYSAHQAEFLLSVKAALKARQENS
jgi:hypothetical protein